MIGVDHVLETETMEVTANRNRDPVNIEEKVSEPEKASLTGAKQASVG